MSIQERIILIIIYSAILITAIIFFFIKQKNKENYCYKGVVFAFLFLYNIIPLIVLCNLSNFIEIARPNSMKYLYQKDFWSYIYSIIITTIGLLGFHIAYSYSKKDKNKVIFQINEEKKRKIVKIMAWSTFTVGVVCLLIFCQAFGGISTALKYAEIMRSFSTSYTDKISYWASILIIPARLVTVSPFLFVLLNDKEKAKKNKIFNIFFLGISLVFSAIYFLLNAGKAPILMFALCFVYAILKLFTKKTWTILIILGILCMPLLGILDSTFLYFANGKFEMNNVNYFKYISQFTYPVQNTINVADIVEKYGYRYGTDYITGVLNILPKVNFKPSYEDTSEFYGGENWKEKGGVPNDFITFSYLQLGILGIIIISGILGWLLERIDRRTIKLEKNLQGNLLCGVLTVYSFNIILNADPEPVIKGNLIYFAIIFLLLYTIRIKKGKRSKI